MGHRELYHVPVAALAADPPGNPSPKGYRDDEVRAWMAHVPQIYRLRRHGWTDADFDRLRSSRNPKERQLAKTEAALFRGDGANLRAAYDGRAILLENGHHRVAAARALGVETLPVRVWAEAADHARLVEQYGVPERGGRDHRNRSESERTR